MYHRDNKMPINIQIKNEAVVLTQYQMANLLDKPKKTIGGRIGNIFDEGKLTESLGVQKNQKINKIITCSEVLSNCVEYSRFPNFVEMM